MRPQQWVRGAQSRQSVLVRLVTIAVVVALVTTPMGVAAAQSETTQTSDTYAVAQGGNCFTVTAFTGTESVKQLYDYRTPYPDNPYANTTGDTFSSHGTTAIQEVNKSVLFLYQQRGDGDETLSLVMVHGAYDQYPSAGGAATFDITGLPEDGRWAVRDDTYDNGDNYDNWSVQPGRTTVDWTWGPQRTDGGAFAGLGEEFTVTIDPKFNQNAPLYGEYYNGSLEGWDAVSDEQTDSPNTTYNRTALDGVEPVTISTQSCGELTGEQSETATAGNGTTAQDADSNESSSAAEQTPTATEDASDTNGTVTQEQAVSLQWDAVDSEEVSAWLDEWLGATFAETDVSVAELDDDAVDELIERIEAGERIDANWLGEWLDDALGEQVTVDP